MQREDISNKYKKDLYLEFIKNQQSTPMYILEKAWESWPIQTFDDVWSY